MLSSPIPSKLEDQIFFSTPRWDPYSPCIALHSAFCVFRSGSTKAARARMTNSDSFEP